MAIAQLGLAADRYAGLHGGRTNPRPTQSPRSSSAAHGYRRGRPDFRADRARRRQLRRVDPTARPALARRRRRQRPFRGNFNTPPGFGRCACRSALYLRQHRNSEGGRQQPTQPAPARPAICGRLPHRCGRRLHASERPHHDRRLPRDAVGFVDGGETAHRRRRGARIARRSSPDHHATGDDYIRCTSPGACTDQRKPVRRSRTRFA